MIRLLLLRHAKSSWADDSLDDHDRPLNGRGRRAATAMGRRIADGGQAPARILCSSALRARATLMGVLEMIPARVETLIAPDLYAADAGGLIDIIRARGGKATPLLVIGHNPAMESAAALLSGPEGDAEARDGLGRKYPTAALAELTFDLKRWDDLAPGAGRLERFTIPRDLEAVGGIPGTGRDLRAGFNGGV